MKQLLFTGLALTVILSSCTMEKRQYMSGYHIEWLRNNHGNNIQSTAKADTPAQKLETKNETSTEVIVPTKSNITSNVSATIPSSQPNNTPITAKYTSLKNTSTTIQSTFKTTPETKTFVKTRVRTAMPAPPTSGGKSQIIALILCFFLGALGIHRFYLGYTGIGILMLLTGGCCGVLALIDFIRIITGGLKPKDGDYSERL